METQIPRLLIGGVSSNCGKTTLMTALAALYRKKGLKVKCFKCGPDYLDPTYHKRSTGEASINLDSWMMGKKGIQKAFIRECQGYDLALIEGVMGLFDGASSTKESGSSAEIAKTLGSPVALLIDSSGMARTIKALAHGFKTFDPDLRLSGVICNKVGSEGHLKILREALSGTTLCFGGILKGEEKFKYPGRHLGLVTARKNLLSQEAFDYWENHIEKLLNLDLLYEEAKKATPLSLEIESSKEEKKFPVRIGYAFDDAFHFYYPDNMALLKKWGAELVPFSPISDTHLPLDLDGIYFGGGYPEVYAQNLSENESLIKEIKNFKGPIYGECGGLIYLSDSLELVSGEKYSMLGLIEGHVAMEEKLKGLGYVEVEILEDGPLGYKGERFRGHQFRYSTIQGTEGNEAQFKVRKKRGNQISEEGYRKNNVVGTYIHAHWTSNEKIPLNFIKKAHAFRENGLV